MNRLFIISFIVKKGYIDDYLGYISCDSLLDCVGFLNKEIEITVETSFISESEEKYFGNGQRYYDAKTIIGWKATIFSNELFRYIKNGNNYS